MLHHLRVPQYFDENVFTTRLNPNPLHFAVTGHPVFIDATSTTVKHAARKQIVNTVPGFILTEWIRALRPRFESYTLGI